MKLFLFANFLFADFLCYGQDKIYNIINDEYECGHFNGSVLVAKDGKIITAINKGYANFQFKVPIDSNTRFPIASVTKLFTTIAILQLKEKSLINFGEKISKYIDTLPANCADINIGNLLIHYSGLANEPVKAYKSKYNIDEFIKYFVTRKQTSDSIAFNYNNVDFVLLSKIIEKVTHKTYLEVIRSEILAPSEMSSTGLVNDDIIIPYLAYGYHNYSFGTGMKGDALYNDHRFLSNYSGAGQIYSTTQDLYKLLIALKENKLISQITKDKYLTKVQKNINIDWIEGDPTYGFYYNAKLYNYPTLRRDGSIGGFNSSIFIDNNFNRIVIILCNTDTADVSELSKKLFNIIQ